jgi:AraC family transcriptional regulator, regulatory protein of adaptative response / methylated-DNA-[protein]-cysteine methyltransferase
VTSALYDTGYGSSSRLYERAPAQLGMTPAAYRRGGAGVCIHYTIVDSALGRLLVAATGKGICFVSLGDDDTALLADLRKDYPAAQIETDGRELQPWVSAIVEYLSGQPAPLDLPLDVQATAFQRRVWRELQAIPYGSTRTYGDIANAIGNPNAVRAVSRACATNPVALVVPCHRVIRSNGSLAGYRWGLARKERLLEQERIGVK